VVQKKLHINMIVWRENIERFKKNTRFRIDKGMLYQ
jgi:hypothetical protein